MSDNSRSILATAKHFFFGTLLSRFSGFFRDMAMAFCFGSAPEVASFMVAYRLANLFRKLFGEGNAQAGFTPHFERMRAEGERGAFLFYRDAAWSMGVVLVGIVALLMGSLWFLHGSLSGEWAEITMLTVWMIPGLLFICLFGLHNALLQCQKQAFWPAAAPVAFNLATTAAIIAAQANETMRPLAFGVTLAYGVQWVLTGLQVRKQLKLHLTLAEWFRPNFFSPEWRAMMRAMMLGIVGVGAVQINSALDALFGKIADPSGPAYLWYAIRIEQLPMALFGVALSGALLPPLARALSSESLHTYHELLSGALKHSLSLIVPCTFGILALGHSGLNLLYGHGDFSKADVVATKHCLWAYGLSLVPAVLVLMLAQGFYAQKKYSVPTTASVISVVVNVVLNAVFVFAFHWGAFSIALATAVSAWVNLGVLVRSLHKQGAWNHPLSGNFVGRLAVACAVPCALTMALGLLWPDQSPRSFLAQVGQFGAESVVFLGGVWVLARRLRLTELFELVSRRI